MKDPSFKAAANFLASNGAVRTPVPVTSAPSHQPTQKCPARPPQAAPAPLSSRTEQVPGVATGPALARSPPFTALPVKVGGSGAAGQRGARVDTRGASGSAGTASTVPSSGPEGGPRLPSLRGPSTEEGGPGETHTEVPGAPAPPAFVTPALRRGSQGTSGGRKPTTGSMEVWETGRLGWRT